MEEFKQGDLVHLKSGGPQMTIARLDKEWGYIGVGDEREIKVVGIDCHWFDGKKLQSSTFHPAQLLPAEEAQAKQKPEEAA